MTIARSVVALLGTSESAGVTIATTATSTGSEIDLYGGDGFTGEVNVYLAFTSTVTAGTIDLSLQFSRVPGTPYTTVPLIYSIAPINGSILALVTPTFRIPVARRVTASVKNNATGANATNVFVGVELWLYS